MSKIGRNDPCHCGSGKKYKKCCLNQKSAKNQSTSINDLNNLREEFSQYDNFELIQLLSRLIICPENHSHLIRLETAIGLAYVSENNGQKSITFPKLKTILNKLINNCIYVRVTKY